MKKQICHGLILPFALAAALIMASCSAAEYTPGGVGFTSRPARTPYPSPELDEDAVTTASLPPEDGERVPSVFMYHLILEEPYGVYTNLFVRPSDFARQLDIIEEAGCEYLFADDYRTTAVPSVMLTFDDGYEDNYTEMFPILRDHSAKATVFLVSDMIGSDGYLSEEQIREMAESGLVSFQCHTASHTDLSRASAEAVRSEFERSIGEIERITGSKVTALAYPAGKWNDETLAVAGEFFNYAYTTAAPDGGAAANLLLIPRYGVRRGVSERGFEAMMPD